MEIKELRKKKKKLEKDIFNIILEFEKETDETINAVYLEAEEFCNAGQDPRFIHICLDEI